MNKKRLSVVMAGAMLASSVAPVLAAEVQKSEVEKGALINELTEKIFNAPRFNADSKDARVAANLRGASIYGIKIGKTVTSFEAYTTEANASESGLQARIKTLVEGRKAGEVVELVDLGSRLVEGENVYVSTTSSTKYTEAELKYEGAGTVDAAIKAMDGTAKATLIKTNAYADGVYTITFNNGVDIDGDGNSTADKLELTTDSERLDFTRFINKNNKDKEENITNSVTTSQFGGFGKADPIHSDIPASTIAEYTIVSGGDTFKLADLYDGLYLTTEGQNILDVAKEALVKAGTNVTNQKNAIQINDANDSSARRDNGDLGTIDSLKPNKGNYAIDIVIGTDTYSVSATNEVQLKKFAKWIDMASAEVEVIAGEDRYATAVKLAKEVNLKSLIKNNKSGTYNIVLVNGNSLVDGLAAAPLAQYLAKENGGTGNAPILLTKANELPRATQRYLRELIDTQSNKEITVTLVGGEAVISNNVRKQLRSLGLNVERLGGEDREATSMAVANEIGFDNGAFVVGAKGEADAMSVSGYAASKVAPVVVSGFGGLSEDTIDALDGAKVNIIGGESKVSKAEEEELSAIADSVHRIAGEDRKATNAAVINTFYKKSFATAPQSVIVAKDDVLIDALTAANLSVVDNAPIVLGRNSLSAAQKAAIAYNASSARKVYQMSKDVAREVTKAVAQALKLS